MILSSADILRVLGGDPVIRQEARLSIVDDKPGIGLDEYVYIYVQRYPTIDEFEATWKIWVQDGGSDVLDLVLAAMTRMLPNFDYHKTHYSTTDFKSDRTEVEPEEELEFTEQDELNARFKLLSDEVLRKVNGLRDGLDGIDGLTGPQGPAGRDGIDGRDGRDIEATDTDLEDLRNVEQGIPYEKGQVLTWDGTKWTNLYVQQVFKSGGGTGGGGGTNLPDGNYVDQPLTWDGTNWVPGQSIQFDINNNVNVSEGELGWESDEQTLIYGINGIHAHVGHDLWQWCRNNTGITIPKGTVVMFTGTLGASGRVTMAPLVANGTQPGYVILGITAEDVLNDNDGAVFANGKIKNIDTTAFPEGSILWADPVTPGGLTLTEPTAPNLKLPIAAVISSHINGTLLVRVTTGDRLYDLHDVDLTTTAPSAGDFLSYNGTVWQTKQSVDVADGGDFGGLPNPDGGDFNTGTTTSTLAYPVDGGDFNTGETGAFGDTLFNGGLIT